MYPRLGKNSHVDGYFVKRNKVGWPKKLRYTRNVLHNLYQEYSVPQARFVTLMKTLTSIVAVLVSAIEHIDIIRLF